MGAILHSVFLIFDIIIAMIPIMNIIVINGIKYITDITDEAALPASLFVIIVPIITNVHNIIMHNIEIDAITSSSLIKYYEM